MSNIELPYNWEPRDYQVPLWNFFATGGKRAVAVWHRRAGKDSLALNWTACAAHQKVGVYWHMLPTAKQARKVIWNGIDKQGRRFIDQAFPKKLRSRTQNTEMTIEFKCGSIYQLCGSDNYDSLVGANPVGLVFSEWALADPNAWKYLSPILRENNGWVLFIYTPRGRNHGSRTFDTGTQLEHWFAEKMWPYNPTSSALPPHTRLSGVFNSQQIQEVRLEDELDDDDIDQEYFCSFDSAIKGSYYGKTMKRLEDQGRFREGIYDPKLEVHTAWDLGVDDATAIWFVQVYGNEYRLIDYYENSGEGLKHYVNVLRGNEEGGYHRADYLYGKHYLPHDANVKELGTGQSRLETLRELGLRGTVVRKLSVADGIQAVRNVLPVCWFDPKMCQRGIDAMRQYQREYDEKRGTPKTIPLHDWTSHAADAFRYLAVARPRNTTKRRREKQDHSWIV